MFNRQRAVVWWYAGTRCAFSFIHYWWAVWLGSRAHCMHVCNITIKEMRERKRNSEMREKALHRWWWYGRALIVRISVNTNLFSKNVHALCCCCCCDTIRNRRERMSMYLAAGRNNHLLFALHAFRCGIANVILYIVLQMLTAFVYSHMNNMRSNYKAKQNNQQQLKRKNLFNGKEMKKKKNISESVTAWTTHTWTYVTYMAYRRIDDGLWMSLPVWIWSKHFIMKWRSRSISRSINRICSGHIMSN